MKFSMFRLGLHRTGEILSGSRPLLKKGSCVFKERRDECLFRATNEKFIFAIN
jgi:hypothetical protein